MKSRQTQARRELAELIGKLLLANTLTWIVAAIVVFGLIVLASLVPH